MYSTIWKEILAHCVLLSDMRLIEFLLHFYFLYFYICGKNAINAMGCNKILGISRSANT